MMSDLKVGDIVEGLLGQKGPITEIKGDRVVFRITDEELEMDMSYYEIGESPNIIKSHLVMDSPIQDVKLIKKQNKDE